MRKMNSVFGKVLVSVMLIVGLTAVSCNQRSDVKVRDRDNEDVRIRERMDNDSVDIMRDQSIEPTDEDGYGDTKVRDNTRIDLERDHDIGRDTTVTP